MNRRNSQKTCNSDLEPNYYPSSPCPRTSTQITFNSILFYLVYLFQRFELEIVTPMTRTEPIFFSSTYICRGRYMIPKCIDVKSRETVPNLRPKPQASAHSSDASAPGMDAHGYISCHPRLERCSQLEHSSNLQIQTSPLAPTTEACGP